MFSENQILSVLNSLETTGTFLHSFGRISLLNLFKPMGITVHFSRLTFKPEVLSNCLSIVKAKLIDLLSFKNSVVSSASWHNLISTLLIFTPLNDFSSLIFIASVSTTKINSRADIGDPCLIPLVR